MNVDKLAQINKTNADNQLSTKRHDDILQASVNTSNTVLSATASLIQYLEGHIQKSEVINQLTSIDTPDALEVIPYIEALHATIRAHKDTDLTELTKLMTDMLAETKAIPKDHMKMPEMKMVDYSDQLKSLKEAIIAVGQFVKDQKTVVEAPVVHVDAPNVNIPPTDLKPLQKDIKGVVDAIKKIIIPEYKTDNAKVEGLITKSNKLLKELIDKPVSSGGGGGGRATPYQDSNGVPAFVELINGKIPVDATITVPPVTIDTTGLATDAIQTNGTQKTQIVDAGGDAVTVTGGKLDVNVTIPPVTIDTTGLATDTLQTSGNSSLTTIAGKDFATETTLALIKAKTDNIDVALSTRTKAADTQKTQEQNPITNFANETGGNLAAIKAKTDNIPVQGQALATGSLPVVLTAAQVSTLTPPAAITGFATSAKQLPDGHNVVVTSMPAVSVDTTGLATSAKQDTGNTSTGSIDTKTPALGQALAAASVPVILPTATITTLTPPAAITGFATSAKQLADNHQVTVSNIASAPVITGFATETTLGTVHGHVDSIDTKTPALGQALAAASVPVVLTSAQMTTLTPPAQGLTDTQLRNTAVPVSLASVPSHAVTFTGSTDVATQTTLAAMNAKMVTGTDIGDVTINNSTGAAAVNIQDGGNTITVDGTVAVTNAGITTIAGAVTGTEMQVDVLTMPTVTVNAHAVTNAGTFAVQSTNQANSGVDIGDVTVNNSTGASAVNIQDGGNSITVDGTFYQATQPVSLASMPSTPVTGTFYQATQPVSLATNTPTIATGTNAIGTVGTTSAAVNVNQVTVNTAAVQLSAASTVPTNGIIVQALSTNAATLFVGGSGVTTSNGFELSPGQAMSFTCNLNTLYIRSAASTTDKVCYNVQ